MHIAPWLWIVVVVLILWGLTAVFQKLTTNYISAESTLVWRTVGFLLFMPFVYPGRELYQHSLHSMTYGFLAGLLCALGCLGLFAAMKSGGKASIVGPLSALYPIIVVILSPFVLHESITALQGVGVLCGLVAVVLLSI
jgi:transporter family protein